MIKTRTALNWLWLSSLIVFVDRLTKINAVSEAYHGFSITPFLNFTLAYNKGAAFSFLSQAGGWQKYFFIGISIVVSVGILIWLYQLPKHAKLEAISVSCILGGAIGNLWDRVQLGAVIDFIDFYVANWHWPIFNVADIAISIGTGLLIVSYFKDLTVGKKTPQS